jgi:phosphate transport system protein
MPTDLREHIVRSFDEKLGELRGLLLRMAEAAEAQVDAACRALSARDATAAEAVVAADPAIDRLAQEVEAAAIAMLATRQPVAVDLRTIVAALKIARDLERIGDQAKGIARHTAALAALPQIPSPNGWAGLTGRVQEVLRLALASLRRGDPQAARQAWAADEPVDAVYNGLVRELLTHMMEDTRSIGAGTHLLFAAKNLERIGDHATNIAEAVHYAEAGDPLPLDRPRGEDLPDTPAG